MTSKNSPAAKGTLAALGMSLAPVHAATAYATHLNRAKPTTLSAYDRAFSRALNSFNQQWLGNGIEVVASARAALSAVQAMAPAFAWAKAPDAALARQESCLRETARKTVHMLYAY